MLFGHNPNFLFKSSFIVLLENAKIGLWNAPKLPEGMLDRLDDASLKVKFLPKLTGKFNTFINQEIIRLQILPSIISSI